MKIQCNVCEAAEAKVLCCADEAALCGECDEKVHAACKLSSKHQRVPLSTSSSQMPKCDICQETVGYFFCLEDRALLCRRCDVAIHTANRLVSAHQRFLLTGVKVGLETAKLEKTSGSNPPPAPKSTTTLLSTTDQSNKTLPSVAGDISLSNLDEFLELGNADFTQNYDFMDPGSSKADFGRLRDADCLPLLRVGNMEVEGEGCMGQSPDTLWTVPQIPSPPTASGLYWPKIGARYHLLTCTPPW